LRRGSSRGELGFRHRARVRASHAGAAEACERKAADVRPILNAPELEQFIANCLADATAESGSSSGKKSGGKY